MMEREIQGDLCVRLETKKTRGGMEDKKANLIALAIVFFFLVFTVAARVLLKLSKAFFLLCGFDVALVAAIFVHVGIRRRYSERRKLMESRLVSEGRELRMEYSFLRKVAGVPTKFRYRELEEATDGFTSLWGKGASGSVFKGVLGDGTSVAVKRIEGEENGEKAFRSEVSAIASVQHVNLVHLIGYCITPDSGSRFLVYDFIPNGSLDCWIFPEKTRSKGTRRAGGCLSWDSRYRVALDVAKALSYLHHDCRSIVLHLDVKPENILLDENLRAIVSDFGLSKLLRKNESKLVTTARGTKGYLAPEWLLDQGISEKSDIYSYGMVLLEMIGGQRNICLVENEKNKPDKKWQYFPRVVSDKKRQGKLMEVVDSRVLEGEIVDERELNRLANVALWCIQEKARLRPSMARVVEMLEGRLTVEEPPDTKMIIVDLLAIDDGSTHFDNKKATLAGEGFSSDHPSLSMCSVSMSAISAR